MTNIELALTNLGEVAATEFHRKNDSIGLSELKEDVNKAGRVVNHAKNDIEKELEHSVVTSENYLDLTSKRDLLDTK